MDDFQQRIEWPATLAEYKLRLSELKRNGYTKGSGYINDRHTDEWKRAGR